MRRGIGPSDAADKQPLHFTVGSDSDEDFPVKPTARTPPPLFHHIRDTHPPPSYAHVLVNRFLLRVFPRILLMLMLILLLVALIPGGWRVALCTADILPPPSLHRDENITVIGHRGSEFPYPENSMQALNAATEATNFVEFDIALTSDKSVILMHDIAYNRSTNGTGLTCMYPQEYVNTLQLKMPERDPRGRLAQGQFCVTKNVVGTTPCVYRVARLSDVFEELPLSTRFMIDIKECYAPDMTVSAALCSNCTVLAQEVKTLMERRFINPNRVVFTSTEGASLFEFRKWMAPNSTYSISADARYSRYTKSAFMKVLSDGDFDSVSMSVSLAALRPDLVRVIRQSTRSDGSTPRIVYGWTVRKDIDYKLARCAGVSHLVAAEPTKLKQKLKSDGIGLLLSETT